MVDGSWRGECAATRVDGEEAGKGYTWDGTGAAVAATGGRHIRTEPECQTARAHCQQLEQR